MNSLIVSALILALFAGQAFGQTETVGPIYAVKPTPDIGAIHRAYGGAVKNLTWWANIVGDTRLGNRVGELRTIATNEAASLIDWTGLGVLYELRVMRRTLQNEAGLYDAYLEGDSAVQIAIGATAEEALFNKPDQLRPGARHGYTYDPIYSHYFFVTRTDGTLQSTTVPRGAALDLHQALQNNFGDLQLKYGLAARSNGERYAAIASSARQRIQGADLLARLNRSEKVLKDSVATVARLDKEMRAASEKAEKAAREAQRIAILNTIVSAAQLAADASSNIGDPALNLDGATDSKVVYERVKTYEDAQIRIRSQLTVELKNGLDSYQRALGEFKDAIAPASPPPQVTKTLDAPPQT